VQFMGWENPNAAADTTKVEPSISMMLFDDSFDMSLAKTDATACGGANIGLSFDAADAKDDSGDVDEDSEATFFCSADSSDVGYWDHSGSDHAGYRGPRWVATQSERNGFQAAQILKSAKATDEERQRAVDLILDSPNPEHAVWTANNGIPTEYGIFRNTYSDNLIANNLRLTMEYRTINHPAQGNPTDAGYRPAYTSSVPSSLTLTRR
jgi:hypothetical protein